MHQLIGVFDFNLGGYAQSETKFYEWTGDWIEFQTVIFKAQRSHWFLAIMSAIREKTGNIAGQRHWEAKVLSDCVVLSRVFP